VDILEFYRLMSIKSLAVTGDFHHLLKFALPLGVDEYNPEGFLFLSFEAVLGIVEDYRVSFQCQ